MNAAPAEHPTRVLGPGRRAAVRLLIDVADNLAHAGHFDAAQWAANTAADLATAPLTRRPADRNPA